MLGLRRRRLDRELHLLCVVALTAALALDLAVALASAAVAQAADRRYDRPSAAAALATPAALAATGGQRRGAVR